MNGSHDKDLTSVDQQGESHGSHGSSSHARHWAVLVGCCLLIGTAFALPMLSFGVFVSPIVSDFGCKVTEVSIYFTFSGFASVFSSLVGARVLGRNMRVTVMACAAVIWLGFFLLATFPSVQMVWVCGTMVGLAVPLCTTVLVPIAINNWFAIRQGTYMGIVFAMVGIFGMVLSPIATALIGWLGWRTALVALASCMLIIDVLVAVFMLRQDPASVGMRAYGAAEVAAGDSANVVENTGGAKDAPAPASSSFVRTPTFVLCVLAALLSGFMAGFNTQLNTVAQQSGFDPVTAGLALSCASAGLVLGKLLMGAVKDRKGSTFAIGMGCTFGVVAFAAVAFGVATNNVMLLYAGCFLTGFCTCLGTLVPALLVSEAFEGSLYALGVSYITACCSLGMACSVPFYTVTFDSLGSFMPVLVVCVVIPVVVALVAAFAIRTGKAAQAL